MEDLVLEVETRRRIYQVVCDFPGLHLREVSRIVGLATNLVDYHLVCLEKRDIVRSVQDDQFKRYFAENVSISTSDKRWIGMLRQTTPFRIVILLLDRENQTNKELAANLFKSPGTVTYHLGKLVEAGLVVKLQDRRGFSLSDPRRVERILMAFHPLPEVLTSGFREIWEEFEFLL